MPECRLAAAPRAPPVPLRVPVPRGNRGRRRNSLLYEEFRQVETVDGSRGTAVTVATATKESRGGGGEKLTVDNPKSKLIDPPYRPVTLRVKTASGM